MKTTTVNNTAPGTVPGDINPDEIEIRLMTPEDYEEVHALWMTIRGFSIRSIDDSKEGVERF